MPLKKGTTTKVIAVLILLCMAFTATAAFSPAQAQTVLSPTAFMPFKDGGLPLEIPSVISLESQSATDDRPFRIPLMLNGSVERQIEYFTTRGRAVFQSWLNRSARYISVMRKIFREYNLPEDLVYVAMIESGFNPNAVSPKKAVGCWQFMEPTAREYGLNANRWVDERKDPIKSTRAAAAHFKDLYNLFGSWSMVLASYNAGMGTMRGAVLKAGSADFWELSASRFLRNETQEYVPRYLAALIIAKNPVAYGFTAPRERPFVFDEVVVHSSTDLRRIADYTGSTCKDIQELNPELLQLRTPRNPYILRIPRGTKDAYRQRVSKTTVRGRKFREKPSERRGTDFLFSRTTPPPPQTAADDQAPPSMISSPHAARPGIARSASNRGAEENRILR